MTCACGARVAGDCEFRLGRIDIAASGCLAFDDATSLIERATNGHGVSFVSMPPASLDRVYRVVGECFPEIISETIICLSVAATLLLEDQQNPVALNLEGVPSSQKTTLVDFFGDDDKVYRSDKFTPKSFVSHSASISREKLAEVDLLPRIKHKVFLVPELAPLFGLRQEDLLESFSILTRVLDGQGLQTDSGVHGRRGHTGDFLFAWIGCTTPIPHNVWKTMGKLGSRFLFIEMPAEEQSDAELVRGAAGGISYKDRVELCRDAVAGFLDDLWSVGGGVRGVRWDRAADPASVMLKIAAFSKVLARLRGTISIWREGSGEEESYNFSTPVIEGPQRAMSLLYALARGHALVQGRTAHGGGPADRRQGRARVDPQRSPLGDAATARKRRQRHLSAPPEDTPLLGADSEGDPRNARQTRPRRAP
jgi:hypothetical protein